MNRITWHGLEVVTLENEVIRVGLLPMKGADLIELRYKPLDLDVFWHSPLAWPPCPLDWGQTVDRRGSFLDTFHGGWQVSVPSGFFPTDYFGGSIGIHGDLALRPWDLTGDGERTTTLAVGMVTDGEEPPDWGVPS